MPEKSWFKSTDPAKYLEYLSRLMAEKGASDMYLTYNEPPTLRVMEDVIREKELEKLDDDMLNGIALTLMNQTGVDFFEKHGSIDLGVSYQDRWEKSCALGVSLIAIVQKSKVKLAFHNKFL